jgi:hypothetical protein
VANYRLALTESAEMEFSKLPGSGVALIVGRIERGGVNLWGIRIGDYRVASRGNTGGGYASSPGLKIVIPRPTEILRVASDERKIMLNGGGGDHAAGRPGGPRRSAMACVTGRARFPNKTEF